jgi:hypothetical protein
MLPTQPFYDNSVKSRPYDLSQARHYLELAGYTPNPGTSVGVVNLEGIYNDTSGNPVPNVALDLMSTTDNSTFPTSLTAIDHTTTDDNGFYSFTVNPETSGNYYYYLVDSSTGTAVYTYIGSYAATATSAPLDLTLIAVIVAIVVIVVIIAVILLMRRKPKK